MIVTFKSKKDKNRALMIERLENCLALAKQGKFRTLVTAMVLEDRAVQCTCDGDWLEALGALRVAESRFLEFSNDAPPEEP